MRMRRKRRMGCRQRDQEQHKEGSSGLQMGTDCVDWLVTPTKRAGDILAAGRGWHRWTVHLSSSGVSSLLIQKWLTFENVHPSSHGKSFGMQSPAIIWNALHA
jgi:hypothetical protein